MDKDLEFKLVVSFTITYLLIFTIRAVVFKNFEFIYYTILVALLMLFIQLYHKKMHLAVPIMLLLSVFLFLHFLGGAVYIDGTRLYDTRFLHDIFKYDNLTHTLGATIAAFLAYNMLKPHLDHSIKIHHLYFTFLIVTLTLGIGGFIEIMEFGAVTFANAASGVGDYFNNSWDLIYDTLGGLLAVLILHPYHLSEIEKLGKKVRRI